MEAAARRDCSIQAYSDGADGAGDPVGVREERVCLVGLPLFALEFCQASSAAATPGSKGKLATQLERFAQ